MILILVPHKLISLLLKCITVFVLINVNVKLTRDPLNEFVKSLPEAKCQPPVKNAGLSIKLY